MADLARVWQDPTRGLSCWQEISGLKVGNHNLFHLKHLGKRTGLLYEIFRTGWHNLPAQTVFVFTPATV
jgi:hypothetical protein